MSRIKILNENEILKLREYLHEKFDLDEVNGNLVYKYHCGNRTKGDIAGTVNNETGHNFIRLSKFKWDAAIHKLVTLYKFGYLPVGNVIHRDGNKCNNGFENLKELPILSEELTPDNIRDFFDYDEQSGYLIYKYNTIANEIGDNASGVIDSHGYKNIFMGEYSYKYHRVVWLWWYLKWPDNHIDHVDHDPLNNRISNLRDVTAAENNQNENIARKNSKSGILGASQIESGKFSSTIIANGIRYYLGVFDTAEEAGQAYLDAKSKLHSYYNSIYPQIK